MAGSVIAYLDTGHEREGEGEDDQEGGDARQYDGAGPGPGGVGCTQRKYNYFLSDILWWLVPASASYTENLQIYVGSPPPPPGYIGA